MKKTLHIIPHSHWDREWYQSFEAHRMKLVELFDAIIEEMEKSDEYTYYHMDGQFIPVEDYLEIRPHMRDRLQKLIKEDRIQVGPWYVLQDEFLTSGEANVRNMLYGLKLSKDFGAKPLMTGYFPDAFGNMGQAPQICRGFGIDNAVFGRGLNDIGTDNQIVKQNGITKSEFIWRSPDGSEVLGILLANWYNNAAELPSSPDALKERILRIGKSAERFAETDHLLGMNGSDHQPLQRNLTEVIALANQVQDEYEVKHSNLKDYVAEIRRHKDTLGSFEGEIIGQYTHGYCLLISTASTHIDIKTRNWKAQHTLERIAEPASIISALYGGKYDKDYFLYSWRRLMQNHPHDSICTCSCDEVYDAMIARFDSTQQVSDKLTEAALENIAATVNTDMGGDKTIVVLSLEPGESNGKVCVNVDFERDEKVEAIEVYDKDDKFIPVTFKKIENQFVYTLPKDKFRQPKYVDRFEVEFPIETKGIGFRFYKVRKVDAARNYECPIRVFENGMENEHLKVKFRPDGAFDLTDNRTGKTFFNQNRIEDQSDIGESYNFKADGQAVLCNCAEVSLYKTTPYSATFKTVSVLDSDAVVTSYVTLTEGVERVDISTVIANNGENHRIRSLFDSDIETSQVFSEGQFDLVSRNIEPAITWENEDNLNRTQAFVALESENGAALAIANRGVCEYEILRNGKNTVAITLLRCVKELGDWGIFPTPKAQCKGEFVLEYSVVPYCTECRGSAYRTAYDFAAPAVIAVSAENHIGEEVPESILSFDNPFVHMTALKCSEDRDSVIVRFFNLTSESQSLNIAVDSRFNSVYETRLDEERAEQLAIFEGKLLLSVPPKKIVTLELE